ATPGALPASSALPATVPAVAAAVHPVEPAEQTPTEQRTAETRTDQADAAPAQRPTGRDTTPDGTVRDTTADSTADATADATADSAPNTRQNTTPGTPHTAPRIQQDPNAPTTTEQTVAAPPRTDTTAPPPARQVNGDRPADVIVPPARPHDLPGLPAQDHAPAPRTESPRTQTPDAHPPAQPERVPAQNGHAPRQDTAARVRPVPAGPELGVTGPSERVTNLLSQDGAYEPISLHAWSSADQAVVRRLTDTMTTPTKDLLAVARRPHLAEALGDPRMVLVHYEFHTSSRRTRTWNVLPGDDLPAFTRGSGEVSGRRILREVPATSPEAVAIVRGLGVEELMMSWGRGGGQLLPARLAMNLAAVDAFGLQGVLDLKTYGGPSRSQTGARDYARHGETLRDFLRTQYEHTQAELSRHGIEELVLYRGVAFDEAHRMPTLAAASTGDVVPVPPGLPLQSWTALPGVAKRYTGLGDGAVMAAVVPASRVLATPWTGMGQLPLHEFVVMAGPGDVTVLRPAHVVPADPALAGLLRGLGTRWAGDASTECAQGHRHRGTEGAGLLLYHRGPGGEVHVLMQLRSLETHHGGLWGPVGEARDSGEAPVTAALRGAGEEVRLNLDDVQVRSVHHDDHGGWAYDTVIAELPHRAEAWPASPESIDVRWVPLREVAQLNLHPDFAASWPEVRTALERVAAEDAPASTAAAPAAGRPQPGPAPGPPHGAWAPALSDGFSPIADPRPRNVAEAAAIVHRWNPDGTRGVPDDPPGADRTGSHNAPGDPLDAPSRVERLLNGQADDTPAPLDPALVASGRDLIRRMYVENHDDATAEAVGAMGRIVGTDEPNRAIQGLAEQFFDSVLAVDPLVALYRDAQRQGMAPETARDEAELADVLDRAYPADRHRWLGHEYDYLMPSATPEQARAAGLLAEMMGTPENGAVSGAFIDPVRQRYGMSDLEELYPIVRAAQAEGLLPPATPGPGGFHDALRRFHQEDPARWYGLQGQVRYGLPHLDGPASRMLGVLMGLVPHAPHGSRAETMPLRELARQTDQAGSVEHLLRLALDAQEHGADVAGTPDVTDLTEMLTTHRQRDPYLWDGLRLVTEHGLPLTRDGEVRAAARLAELAGPHPTTPIWRFDPLRRLADESGSGYDVADLAARAAEAARNGFDLFGPVGRHDVVDALSRPEPLMPPAPRADAPGLHGMSPADVREARNAAAAQHARAYEDYLGDHGMRGYMEPGSDLDRALTPTVREYVDSLQARVEAWRRWPDAPEVSFTQDFPAYLRAYEAAVRRAGSDEPVIPLMYDDATAGLGARGGGRGFGLEIEFELPGFSSRADLENIARDLHAAGLTVDGDVHPYHASSRAGYHSGERGGRGLWRLELDRSVSGELVSPILYDEPATWMNILLACDIIRGWGGSATVNTGGHVHVSTRDYDHHLANYVSVAEYVRNHGDTLYRLGHNPATESHRGQAWCRFDPLPAHGYSSIGAVRQDHPHHSAVNMGGMTEDTKGHIEFRMWDGSLDPAVIQAQVKVSLAVVEAAFRTAALDLPPNAGVREEPGTHAGLRSMGSAPDLTEAGSLSFRMLMDEIFWRTADKEQLAALFAATRWPERWKPPPPPEVRV
ncbi:NUDIX domain-containing protein, partial [Nonomuraea sp. NPDC004580]|uniref:NUDIX domain-containing protein n=1 Tax=Nonomuraea sp. NPDC004580 TaxID=3154552 RepID=UPI0033A1C4B4